MSEWRMQADHCQLRFRVPNTATLHLPSLMGHPARTVHLDAGEHTVDVTRSDVTVHREAGANS